MSWWPPSAWFSQAKERRDMERSKLSSLLRGLQDAVQDATAIAGQHNLHLIQQLCDVDLDADGRIKEARPKVMRVWIDPAQTRYIDVPLLSLTNPAGYQLEEVSVDMSIRLTLDEIKEVGFGNTGAQRGSYSVEVCPKGNRRARSDHVGLKLKFKATPLPEGMARVIEDLTRTIVPRVASGPPPNDYTPQEIVHVDPTPDGAGKEVSVRRDPSVCDDSPVTPFTSVRTAAPRVGQPDDSVGSEGRLRAGDAEEGV